MKNYLNYDFDMTEYVKYFDEVPLWSAPFGLKLLDAVHYKREMEVLDIGFGAGFPLIELAARLGESSVVYGVDSWHDVVEVARKKIEYFDLKNIKLFETEIENLPFPDSSIDLITTNNAINNVVDIDKSLWQCFRVLKSQGQFIQTMNLSQTMFEFYDVLKKVLKELYLDTSVVDNHIVKQRPSVDTIINKMTALGFKTRKIEYDQFNYKFADGTAFLNHYFMQIAFMGSWLNMVSTEMHQEVFGRVESLLNDQTTTNGFLQMSIPFVLIEAIKD